MCNVSYTQFNCNVLYTKCKCVMCNTQNLKPPTVIQQASESYELFKGCPAFDIKIQKRSLGPNMVKQGFLLKENALKFIPPTLGKNLLQGCI